MDDRHRRRVLWVTEEPPDHALGGGNIRQAHLFEAIARVFSTDLLLAGSVRDEGVRNAAANVIELPRPRPLHTEHPVGRRALELAIALGSRYPLALSPARPVRRVLADALSAIAQAYDLVCVEHEALAPLVPRSRRKPWIITFHHLYSGMLDSEVELAPGRRQRWVRARDLRKARRLEAFALQSYDRCVVCSEQDAQRLQSLADEGTGNRLAVIPNGVDLTLYKPDAPPAEPRILLPGTLNWSPNIDGALWFCSSIWPQIRAAVPNATLVLAGRSPVPEVQELARVRGVSVHGDVPSMVPYFKAARVVVVPLRVGTGTRIKALEALAAGRSVVGTTIGLDGIGVVDRAHALVADDPDAFAAAVVAVLRRDDVARSLAEAGRALVESRFGWPSVERRFMTMVSDLLDQEGPPLCSERLRRTVA